MTQEEIRRFRERLLKWYRTVKRDLPWRKTRDPYRILVSEIMLQQTKAETVVPYYERFLNHFPDPQSLAESTTEDVLKLWQGLGYYRRARYLQDAARTVLRVHDGEIPTDVRELRKLPGVGEYTAAAVASIAFRTPVAVVDGNVTRVLARVFKLTSPSGSRTLKNEVQELATQLLAPEAPGDFNQAMMELGATVCTPKSPKCSECPVQSFCQAAQDGQPEAYPVSPARHSVPQVHVAVGLIWGDGRLLLSKRFDDVMLGGLWELPGGKIEPGETPAECVKREIQEELGVEVAVGEQVATVRHAYSHFRVVLECFRCEVRSGEPRAIGCADLAWVKPDDLANYPLPTATVKILKAVGLAPARNETGEDQTG
ncbi:MAG: A/G-specific adenine glycosylase [Calditrichaeota bacterium]|nr:A/G-specific adenine glycosylase [Calditrichota bacterium]